ncbi:MAG TPA: 7-cyano-7-deazaguanine synthase, partial [Bellilinea sp.]|nr:7-cyano-7-deazaguanine synthase [Bellilinea sp.]
DGHYADETMRVTVVPNRNAIMLSIAYAVAVAERADIVAAGIHAGDHPIYPDCRPAFAKAFDTMAYIANEGYAKLDLHFSAPFVHKTKTEIVTLGTALGVPYEHTWSCYKGNEIHCGTCGTCVERKEAFIQAGITDPTQYQA